LNAVQSQTWIATAYLVAVNAFQPLSGKVKWFLIILWEWCCTKKIKHCYI
jgi:hypothetical protein